MADGKDLAPPGDTIPRSGGFPVGLGLAFYAGVAGVALVWRGVADGVLPFWPAGVAPTSPDWFQVASGLAVGGLAVAVSRLWTRWAPGGPALEEALAAAVGPLSRTQVWLLAGASGMAEELFFRGALQPQVGLVWASLLFGAAHFVPRPGLRGWSLYAGLVGVALGVLFDQQASVLPPILAHILVNGVNLRWLSRRAQARGRVGR